MQALYEWDASERTSDLKEIIERNLKEFGSGLRDESFLWQLSLNIVEKLPMVDQIVQKVAPERKLSQMNGVDRNILRIGTYELVFGSHEEVPPKVAINESVELAKAFGGDTSARFVNGVLGTVYEGMEELIRDVVPEEERKEILASVEKERREQKSIKKDQ